MADVDDRDGQALSVLLLADDHKGQATTVLDHIDAFRRFSRHRFDVFNPRALTRSLALRLDDYDVVVVHYSLVLISDHYLAPAFREQLAEYRGLKVQYIQDDYRQVNEMTEMIGSLGIDVLLTLVPEREIDHVWPDEKLPRTRKLTTYAGYVSDAAVAYPSQPLDGRAVDVGYRGRELPYWLGRLGQEKAWIAQEFVRRAAGTTLRCDIGWRETDRIYGKSWYEWLSSCRATLGTESGSTITDFDGTLQRRVDAYVLEHPEASFSEVHRELLEPYEGNVMMNIISPRVFEAAALRTALVLFPGTYSGVIEPERHYIALEKDFSNFDDVASRLRDVDGLESMVARTYEEIAKSDKYSLRAMVRQFDDAVAGTARTPKSPGQARLRHELARAERAATLVRYPASRRGHTIPGKGGTAFDRTLRRIGVVRLIGLDPHVLRLVSRVAVTRRPKGLANAVTGDLTRLALLRRAQQGRINAGATYVVEACREHDTLTFRSTRLRPGLELRSLKDADARLNELSAIVWDHSELGGTVHFKISNAWWVGSDVGEGDTPACHTFEALLDMARSTPEAVASALAPLLEAPEIDPVALHVVRRRLPAPLQMLRYPRVYVPKALLTARLFLGDARLRRLAWDAASEGGLIGRVGVGTIVSDLVKLGLLRRARTGNLDVGGNVVMAVSGDALCFRTVPRGSAEPTDLDPTETALVQKIVWDHSSVGRRLVLPGPGHLDFAFGLDGVEPFIALAELLHNHREHVLEAVSGV